MMHADASDYKMVELERVLLSQPLPSVILRGLEHYSSSTEVG